MPGGGSGGRGRRGAPAAVFELGGWRAHKDSCVSVAYVRYQPGFLLTASTDCDVTLWSLEGSQIGVFGVREKPWSLMDRTTWTRAVTSLPQLGADGEVLAGGQTSAEILEATALSAFRDGEQFVHAKAPDMVALAERRRQEGRDADQTREEASKRQMEVYYSQAKSRLDRRVLRKRAPDHSAKVTESVRGAHLAALERARAHQHAADKAAAESGGRGGEPSTPAQRRLHQKMKRMQALRQANSTFAHKLRVHPTDDVMQSRGHTLALKHKRVGGGAAVVLERTTEKSMQGHRRIVAAPGAGPGAGSREAESSGGQFAPGSYPGGFAPTRPGSSQGAGGQGRGR